MKRLKILNTNISELTIEELSKSLIQKNNLMVAVCNANSLVRSYKDDVLQNIINSFDICTPDGFPVAMASRILYKNNQKRVDGFKIFNNTLQMGAEFGTTHYLFGNTEEVNTKIIEKYRKKYPKVKILGYSCPPFLSYKELADQKYFDEIIRLNPDIVWFSFGFPKQENLIKLAKDKFNLTSNLVGVGFTFDWTAGTKKKAPEWLADLGFEWILRLIQEPKRLAKRYFIDNFLFIYYFSKQFLSKSKSI